MANAILRIDCSPKGAVAHSSVLADELISTLMLDHPGTTMTRRVLSQDPAALVDSDFAATMITHQDAEAAWEHPPLRHSEVLIRELEA